MTTTEPEATSPAAEILRQTMTAHRLTVRDVAASTGVSKSRVDQYLHGDPYPATWAVAFARMVGLSPQLVWRLQCDHQLALAMAKEWT